MLSELLTIENSTKVAEEIVAQMEALVAKENFDYDFHVNPKTLKMSYDEEMLSLPLEEWEANSNFQFDANKEGMIRQIINAISNEETITEETELSFVDFLMDIRSSLNDLHKNRIANAIRSRVLKLSAEAVPMNILAIINVEIGPLPDPRKGEGSPFLLSVQKMTSKEAFSQASSVSDDLLSRCVETGLDPNDVIAERKSAGDERYASIVGATLKKIVFEVRVDMFVDYSMTMPNNETVSSPQG